MTSSVTEIIYSAQKGKIKQKYGFLTGNYQMFEEGRQEAIEENEQSCPPAENDTTDNNSLNKQ